MTYDFNRPFVKILQLGIFVTNDAEEARLYGKSVRAIEMSNVEYTVRHAKQSGERRMKPPPSHGRIFPGYLVVRKMGTKDEYETWMPDHVFEEIYIPSLSTAN